MSELDRVSQLNKRQVASWCLYDFANSGYSAVIAAVLFPVYYTSVIVPEHGDLWWGRAVSLSIAIVALSSPFIGGIADFGGFRKRLLFIYTAVCVTAVSLLGLLKPGMALEGFALFVIANVAMEGGLVFYNSFLNDIAPKEWRGRVSSYGFAVGYVGSILSLVIALPLVKGEHFAAIWLLTAGLFLVFSLPAFLYLPSDVKKEGRRSLDAAREGLAYTWTAFKAIWKEKEARKFLIAYLIYQDGVNTVIVFSSVFAAKTLGFKPGELIMLFVFVQVTALVGSLLMARSVDYRGPKKVVMFALVLWTMVTVFAYFAQTKLQFWAVALIAGTGLGVVQASTRAFFSRFIPKGRESEYFGVYSMVGKTSAMAGPLLFGYMSYTFGSQRPAILVFSLFFLTGLVLIGFVKGGEGSALRQPEGRP